MCGGAQVSVRIEVDAGRWSKPFLRQAILKGVLAKAALRSARRARFNADDSAPKRQEGMLTYVFVAQ